MNSLKNYLFVLQDNPTGWGPNTIPSQYKGKQNHYIHCVHVRSYIFMLVYYHIRLSILTVKILIVSNLAAFHNICVNLDLIQLSYKS